MTLKFTKKMDCNKFAAEFYKIQPVRFDSQQQWWIWDSKKCRWYKGDEIDILNSFRIVDSYSMTIHNQHLKVKLLDALRRVARSHRIPNADPYWVQFDDTIYDLRTGKNFKATSDYFVTNPIPHKMGKSDDCKKIDKLFRDWAIPFGSKDDSWVRTLYEISAYSMLSCQPLQKLFVLTGSGANGKSTYMRLLQTFLGSDNCATSEIKYITGVRFETSHLYRKLLIVASEATEQELNDSVVLKKLSGEEDVRYEFKGAQAFDEKSYATFILATNALPVTVDKSVGFYRRWLVVDFPNMFEVGNDVFAEIDESEYERFACKLFNVAKALLKKRLFTNEGTLAEKVERYERRSNPLDHFIKSFYERDTNSCDIAFMDFEKDFSEWLKKTDNRVMSSWMIGHLLKSMGYQRDTVRAGSSTKVMIVGLKKKDNKDREEKKFSDKSQKQLADDTVNVDLHPFIGGKSERKSS